MKDKNTQKKGTLYLIPSPLSPFQKTFLLPQGYKLVRDLKTFIVETPKTARKTLALLKLSTPIQQLSTMVLDEHTRPSAFPKLINPLMKGEDVGLMSDSGSPAVADPGSKLVLLAHRNGIKVVPLIGPSSILLAIMGSGLSGQTFTFHGYLPSQKERRIRKLSSIEGIAKKFKQTQVFIETPYRNQHMFEDILQTLNPDTLLSLAIDISTPRERFITLPLAVWKRERVELKNSQVVFLIN